MLNAFGMSELSGVTTLGCGTQGYESDFNLWNSGMALPGTAVKIIDKDSTGEGEVCLKGRQVMKGYYKNEKATASTFEADGFLKSGDLGFLDHSNFLKISGRKKELIITAGGENVAPVPIEDIFKALCPACSNIIVVGENRRFISALITFKVEIDLKAGKPTNTLTSETAEYITKHCGTTLKTSDEACKNAKVLQHIQQLVTSTNKKLISRAAQIRKFKLIPTDFSMSGGELTPTTKLRRKVTELKYKKEIE